MTSSNYDGGRGLKRAGQGRAASHANKASDLDAAVAAVERAAGLTYAVANRLVAITEDDAQTAVEAARQARRLGFSDLDATQAARAATAQADLARLAAQVAPGPAAAGWLDADWSTLSAGIMDSADFVACGILVTAKQAKLGPLVLPLLNGGNIVLAAGTGHSAVTSLLQSVVLRALASTGAGQLGLHEVDPKLRGVLAPFASLREVGEALFAPTVTQEDGVDHLLRRLSEDVLRIRHMYGGHDKTLAEFRREVGQPIEGYKLVVVVDFPAAFTAQSVDQFATLMRTAPACGLSFLIHYNPDVAVPRDADLEPVLNSAPRLTLDSDAGHATYDAVAPLQIDVGSAPSLALVEPVVAQLHAAAKSAAAPRIPFGELQGSANSYWKSSSAKRITAVIGRVGGRPVEITLGDENEQRHNILVSGAIGQGKSNLLMVLVHSFATRYPPSELQMYLLDFKDGVTLFPLAPGPGQEHWLPHAVVLGLESDRAFGGATLTHLVEEFDRRAKLMRPYGDSVTRFREARPDLELPRLLIMIDEFHVLFESDDDVSRQAVQDLEKLARKGRAYGIHLVLASQTISGITPLLAKQDGIFAQFAVRLALKNTAAESQAVLERGNTAAADLRYRGELIVNTDFGRASASSAQQRAVVALAEPAELSRLRSKLWAKARPGLKPPVILDGSRPSTFAELTPILARLRNRTDPTERFALLGRPVAVRDTPVIFPVGAGSGRHLAVLGAGETVRGDAALSDERPAGESQDIAVGTLQAAACSLALQEVAADACFTVINLLPQARAERAGMTRFVEALQLTGAAVLQPSARNLAKTLADLADEIMTRQQASAQSAPHYVVAFGMERATRLQDIDLATGRAPADSLQDLLRDGAQVGVHLLASWGNVRSYLEQLGFRATDTMEGVLLLRATQKDAVDLFGPFVTWTSPANRGLFRDVAQASDPVPIVPCGPFRATDVAAVAELLGNRVT